MPGVIEIVGLIASVLDLAGKLRSLITGIRNPASKSFWETSGCNGFVKYLTIVENILRPYKDPAWQEFEAMIMIVQAVKDELEKAWKLVFDSQRTNGWWRRLSADRFAKDLGESQAEIKKYVDLIPAAAASRTAQDGHEHRGNEDLDRAIALSLNKEEQREDGHEHSGNEDLDRAIALSLCEEEQREANSREERSQDSLVEEIARPRDEEDDMARATRASIEEIARDLDEKEDLARAIQASLAEY